MKKQKKHQFKYADPELAAIPTQRETTKTAPKKRIESPAILRDLKKTLLLIAFFVAFSGILFLVQIKTNWLAPILRIFGL